MKYTKFAMLFVVLAVAMTVTACGGSGEVNGPGNPTPTPTPSPRMTKIDSWFENARLGVCTDAQNCPRVALNSKGLYPMIKGNDATYDGYKGKILVGVSGKGTYTRDCQASWAGGSKKDESISENGSTQIAVGCLITGTGGFVKPGDKATMTMVLTDNETGAVVAEIFNLEPQ
jgi:hypothetical protein